MCFSCHPHVIASLRTQKTQIKFDKSKYPIVEESQSKSGDAGERSKIEKKARRFQMALPAVSNPNINVAVTVHHWPQDFSALPVIKSSVILRGVVKNAKANLSSDKTAVYSDFEIVPLQVLKDSLSIIGKSPITVSRYGGLIRFNDGNTLWVYKTNLGMPQIGHQYIFFLKATDVDSDLLTAYDIRDGKVFPLDAGIPNFQIYENATETDFLNTLQQKIESPSKIVLN